MQNFHQPEVGQVAVERGGRAAQGFLDGMHRELQRQTAGRAHAFFDSLRQLEMDAVARRDVAAALGYADDGQARLQLGAGQAEIQLPLEIQRGHVRLGGVVEPVAAAEFFHRRGFGW